MFWQPEWRDIDAPRGTWQDVKMNIFVSLLKITSFIIIVKILLWFGNQI